MSKSIQKSEVRVIVKTVRLSRREVRSIERATVARVAKTRRLMSVSEYIRAAIHEALKRDHVDAE
ncbi:MAG: hypothetical protein GY778_20495 [bacterium]|nr:hypothetical protein [bacterium]